MDDQNTPYASAVKWLEADVPPAEVVTRLKASGLSANEIGLLLIAAQRKVQESGKSVDVDGVSIPLDRGERDQMETSGTVGSSGPGMNTNVMIGLGLIAAGVGIFVATGGRFIAYGIVIVGIMRLFRR